MTRQITRAGLILRFRREEHRISDTPNRRDPVPIITITLLQLHRLCLRLRVEGFRLRLRKRTHYSLVCLILGLPFTFSEIKDLYAELESLKDNLYFVKKGWSCHFASPPNHPNLKVDVSPVLVLKINSFRKHQTAKCSKRCSILLIRELVLKYGLLGVLN